MPIKDLTGQQQGAEKRTKYFLTHQLERLAWETEFLFQHAA